MGYRLVAVLGNPRAGRTHARVGSSPTPWALLIVALVAFTPAAVASVSHSGVLSSGTEHQDLVARTPSTASVAPGLHPGTHGASPPYARVNVRSATVVLADAGASRATAVPAGSPNQLVRSLPVRSSQVALGPSPGNGSTYLTAAGFEGLNFTTSGAIPPDVQVAAGPSEVVEMVNLEMGVWTKTGTPIASIALSSLFATSDFISDPRVVYDNQSGRWFASLLDYDTTHSQGYVQLAVSATSAADGVWTIYHTLKSFSSDLPDQPILGINETLLGFGANDFPASLSGYDGAQIWVANKSSALSGGSLSWASFGPFASDFSIHPLRSVGHAVPLYFAETFAGAPGGLSIFTTSGVPPANVTIIRTNVTIGSVANPPPSPQPGTTSQIDAGTAHVEDALATASSLWVIFTNLCTPSGDSLARSCVHLTELTPYSFTVVQDADLGVRGEYLYYPAFALDGSGDLTIVLGESSSTTYPGIVATGQAFNAPKDSFQLLVPVKAGTASENCGGVCRYGDYFGAGEDPNSGLVWVAGEFLTTYTAWQTYLAPLRTVGAVHVSVTHAPTNADTGENVTFQWNVTNSTCLPFLGERCTLTLPTGDGGWNNTTCAVLNGAGTFTHAYRDPGTYAALQGGNLSVYGSLNCSAATLLERIPLTATPITVIAAPTLSVSVSQSFGDVGQMVNFTAVASGGAAPYAFSWSGLPSPCANVSTSTPSCVPSAPGQYSGTVTLTDANRDVIVRPFTYLVNPAPSVRLSANRTTVEAGLSVQLTAAATGGSGSFSFAWAGLPPGCFPLDAPIIDCTPSSGGGFNVVVVATDSAAFPVRSSTLALTVLEPLGAVLHGTPDTVPTGSVILLNVAVTGGMTPLHFVWSGLPPGCGAVDSGQIACTPNAAGTWTVSVVVTDTLGARTVASTTVTATAGFLGLQGNDGLYLSVGLLAVLVVGIAAVGLVLRRSRRAASPEPNRRNAR